MVRPIEIDTDLKEIISWYKERGVPRPILELLPPQGLLVPGVAAGFMIKTDANVAFLEYYITNPKASKQKRDLALDLITDSFLASARAQGILAVYALTNSKRIIELAKSKNFKRTSDKEIWGWRL